MPIPRKPHVLIKGHRDFHTATSDRHRAHAALSERGKVPIRQGHAAALKSISADIRR
jgi:hypothetical protein